ncbi:hypothetical protein BDR26DRAFT_1009252, partial [Obelidium mucronatum]
MSLGLRLFRPHAAAFGRAVGRPLGASLASIASIASAASLRARTQTQTQTQTRTAAAAASQRRCASSLLQASAAPTSAARLAIVPAGATLIYSGVISKAIQALKRVSVVSLLMTWATTPLFAYNLYMDTGKATVAAIAVMGGALIVSSLSTAVIQWCCKPYVISIAQKMQSSENESIPSRELTITRLSFFGTPYAHTVKETDLRVSAGRMFTTWESEAGKQLYYVHTEAIEENTDIGNVADGIVHRAQLMADGIDHTSHENGTGNKENWDDVVKKLREAKNSKS